MGVAIVHFIRRRPDTYWIFIILFLGWIGAAIYIVAEVIPDAGLLRGSFQVFPRRRRIHELERAILDNPSAGNYEELGLLYLDDGDFGRARSCYDRSISQRADSVDPFYRRGVAEVGLGDFAAAAPDLERAVEADPTYDFHRAIGLLAHAYAQTGQTQKAGKLLRKRQRFRRVRRLITTTRCSCRGRGEWMRLGSGCRRLLISGRRCRDIRRGGSERGLEKRMG